ncbi:MAG: alkyl sulfatase C-terminal domain-containing protein, partial [Bacteroides sp.]
GQKAAGKEVIININITDTNESATLILKNGALSNRVGRLHATPNATMSGTKSAIISNLMQPQQTQKSIAGGTLKVDGDVRAIATLLSTLSPSDANFNIVEP